MKHCIAVLVAVSFILSSCEKEGPSGKNTLMDFVVESNGENCSTGGYKIISGLDLNDDNILDQNEIQNTEYICNGDMGSNGVNSLLNVVPEAAGDNCSSGGFKIISGIDLNGNKLLEDDEILNTEYICNGDNGDDGNNGANSLLDVVPEPAGDNCSSGGFRIVSGIDQNGNNLLEEDEIQNSEYICNGDDGSIYSDRLVRLTISTHTMCNWTTDWLISEYPTYNFPDFNKNDYQNVDSIIFVPSMHTDDSNNDCIVELYNITDNVSIENSIVKSNSTGWDFHYSEDIYDYLPSATIDLGIRVKSQNANGNVCIGENSYLYIYLSPE